MLPLPSGQCRLTAGRTRGAQIVTLNIIGNSLYILSLFQNSRKKRSAWMRLGCLKSRFYSEASSMSCMTGGPGISCSLFVGQDTILCVLVSEPSWSSSSRQAQEPDFAMLGSHESSRLKTTFRTFEIAELITSNFKEAIHVSLTLSVGQFLHISKTNRR